MTPHSQACNERFTLILLLCFRLSCAQSDTPATKTPDTVKVGAYIISLHGINFHDQEYTMRFWRWLTKEMIPASVKKQ